MSPLITAVRLLLLALLHCAGAARAEDLAPLSADDRRQFEERALKLRGQAGAMRQEAEAIFTVEHQACWDKFLVTRCQEDARKARVDRLDAVRRVEAEARAIERDLRKRDFAAHDARMAAEAPQRAAEAAAQAERNRQAQQQAMERVERRRLEAEQEQRH